jgi:hypothetical protein
MHISEALSGILIKAAMSADTKSERKERLMHLYQMRLISGEDLTYFIHLGGLKHE